MQGCNFHALYFTSCKVFLTNLAPSPCKAVHCILRLARLCIASLTPCALQDCTLRLARLHLAPCALQGCALQACKPCTLQALKALFRGEYYFTLTKTPPNPVDIYFVHIKIIFSKNLLFSHFPSKKTWKKCTEILHKASNLHTSTKKATPLTSKTWFSKTLDKKRTKSDQK